MTRTALCCLALFFLIAAPASVAEEGEGTVRVTVRKAGDVALATTIEMHMKGATVGEAFASIQAAVDGKVQFVVHESTKDIALPALTLKDTPIIAAVNLMGQLVPDLQLRVSVGSDLESVRSLIDDAGVSADALSEYLPPERGTNVVLVDLAKLDYDENVIKRELRIVPLAKILEGHEIGIDDIATAIETVWSMEPIGRVASLKYHEETNLLICFGTPRHLTLMDEVIEGITGEGLDAGSLKRLGTLEARIQAMRSELSELRYELNDRSTLIAQLREKIQKLEAAGQGKRSK